VPEPLKNRRCHRDFEPLFVTKLNAIRVLTHMSSPNYVGDQPAFRDRGSGLSYGQLPSARSSRVLLNPSLALETLRPKLI